MSESKTARVVSYEQMKVMLDFMSQHVDFATGSLRSLEGRHTARQLWRDLTLILNNCRVGARKTMERWSNYWSDFKNKLKNKVRLLKKRATMHVPGEKGIRPLSKLEKRALIILGPGFEEKCQAQTAVSSTQDNDPGSKQLHQELTKVKVEVEMEASPEKEMHDRNKSPEYRSEADALSDLDEESDSNSNEPTMNALYPEWLIEVERKRADAELSRARAEEARTQVAARAARAANVQATALRALAKAATAQAEAIARIAAVLEKGQPERAPPQTSL